VKVKWSYSSIKTFAQCPKKYYHLKVAQDVVDSGSEATSYGTEMHKAAEDYMKLGVPLPPKFAYLARLMRVLEDIPGDRYCELKLGVKQGDYGVLAPCDFDDPDYWWHGIADLVVINGHKAYSVDYKTSKNAKYADTKQLDLVAGAIFLHFPQVREIKSGLAFVASEEFVKKQHVVTERQDYLKIFDNELDRLATAYENGKWPAMSSPLCGFCPVSECAFNRPSRRR
jgi:hypothetical protein